MPDTSKPAFPTPTPFSGEGMSLRDYFAGQALCGYIACHTGSNDTPDFDTAAEDSYIYADAMLKAREG